MNKLNKMEDKLTDTELKIFVPQKKRTAQKVWSFIGIFIACLVITMPFYSANAMATSLSVADNYGNNQFDGFLDAEGDTWTLTASITNYDEESDISPDQVVLDVSGSQIPFSSCSGDSLETTCEFQSVLEGGIGEGTYPFEVIIYDLVEDPNNENVTEFGSELASDTDSITADGSEPDITFTNIYQEEGEIYLDFTVTDQPSGLCAGIAEVEIIDSDSGSVLESVTLSEEDWLGVCEYDYVNDGETAGLLSAGLTGEGTRYFKIRATDFLGHTETSSARSFDTDFVAPSVIGGSLALLDFGDYVGDYTQVSDVAVNITECTALEQVVATSDYMEFYSQAADCDEVDDDNCIWQCVWEDISINPSGSSISIEVAALDEAGNVGSGTVTETFTSDSAGPVVEFFGTEFLYNENSYLSASSQNKIYLRVGESGSGIDEDSVAANLAAVGGNDWDEPDECYEGEGSDYECYWTVSNSGTSGSTSTKEINIRFLEDRVGNEGDLLAQEIVVDGVAPKVKEIELYGFSAIGEKNYFQSNDDLIAKVTIQETSGLTVYIDANDIVMDAENKYQYGTTDNETGDYVASSLDGWVQFNEESCARDNESFWECEFSVDSIKSGHDSSANLEVLVMDTAGNEAEWNELESDVQNAEGNNGDYSIEIFALDEETQPDFWEVSGTPSPLNGAFIDLDITHLTYPLITMDVKLRSEANAKAALVELDGCEPYVSEEEDGTGPAVSRSLMYGGLGIEPTASPKPKIVLEFEPFESATVFDIATFEGTEFTEVEKEYVCTLRIYSIVDDTAMNYGEVQEVIVAIPFGYSGQGSLDANIDAMIYDSVDRSWFKFLDVIGKIETVMKWVRFGGQVFTAIIDLLTLIDAIVAVTDTSRTPTPAGYAFATAQCLGTEGGKQGILQGVQKIGIIFDILNCNPEPKALSEMPAKDNWYFTWQKNVLKWWGTLKGDWMGSIAISELSETASTQEAAGEDSSATQTGINILGKTSKSSASLYDNIVVSAVGLCLPGLIFNFEKMRQIECTYIKCLQESAATGIATVDICEKTKGYLYCKYIMDEVMSMLPLEGLNFIFEWVKDILLDPFGFIFEIVGAICNNVGCPQKEGGGTFVGICNFFSFLYLVLDVVNDIVGIVQGVKSTQYDVCKEAGVQEILDEVKANKDSEGESVKASDLGESESESTEETGNDEIQ